MMLNVFFVAFVCTFLAANASLSLRQDRKLLNLTSVTTVAVNSLATANGQINVTLTSPSVASLVFPVTSIVATAKAYAISLLGTTVGTVAYTAGLGVGVVSSALTSALTTTALVIDLGTAIAAGATSAAITVASYAAAGVITVYSSATPVVGGTLLYTTSLVGSTVSGLLSTVLGTGSSVYTFTTGALALGSNKYIIVQVNGNILNIANITLFGNITAKI